ncbi:MAG: rhomboid family intramembrane serine protease [Bacteroidota bacterium]|nr:rhomboid family intramembrane serine protease [Bacteroidota bacterium]
MTLSVTLIIIIITVIISLFAFRSQKVMDDLIFYPVAVTGKNQYYRFITYGFIHANIPHLFFNMYAFYLFGGVCENSFIDIFGNSGKLFYVLLYFLALIVSVIPDFFKHRSNYNYMSLGASGAVSAIVFAYIMFDPLRGIGLFFIPIFIPGFLFGILFIIISYFLGKKGGTSINHSAHIWGALFGVAFIIIFSEIFSTYPLLDHFIASVKGLDPHKIISTP